MVTLVPGEPQAGNTGDVCRHTVGSLRIGTDREGVCESKFLAALVEFSQGDKNAEKAVLIAACWKKSYGPNLDGRHPNPSV